MAEPLLIAKGISELFLLPGMANRHGLIADATGTGKTVTLQVMAAAFSHIGVPVFAVDIKGDLGHQQAWQGQPEASGANQEAEPLGLCLLLLPHNLLGRLWAARSSGACYGDRARPADVEPNSQPQ